MTFSYAESFSRNIGWVTPEEQETLRLKRVALAGLGGVGGIELLTLTRLGVGAFHVADLDVFEPSNFNRQVGATMSSLNHSKVDTLIAMAKDINPELEIKAFPKGVQPDTISDFLSGVDLYVDGLDFFAFSARENLYPECEKRRIPAIIAAPFGLGCAMVNFLPGRMTFEEYFCWKGHSDEEKAFRLLVGLAPMVLQRRYLLDRSRANLGERRGPSTGAACQICAGMATTEALKILLKRGKVLAAPWGLQFDAYLQQLVKTWRPWGNNNPIQRLELAILRRQLNGKTSGG